MKMLNDHILFGIMRISATPQLPQFHFPYQEVLNIFNKKISWSDHIQTQKCLGLFFFNLSSTRGTQICIENIVFCGILYCALLFSYQVYV